MRISKRQIEKRRGIAAVETAVVLPVLLIMVLGTIELGTALRASTILQSSVREAGRLANSNWQDVVQPGDTPNEKITRDIRNFVTASGLPGEDVDVAIVHANGSSVGSEFDISDESNDLKLMKIELGLPYSSISLFPTNYLGNRTVKATLTLRAGLGGGLSE